MVLFVDALNQAGEEVDECHDYLDREFSVKLGPPGIYSRPSGEDCCAMWGVQNLRNLGCASLSNDAASAGCSDSEEEQEELTSYESDSGADMP